MSRGVKRFYERQNKMIDAFKELEESGKKKEWETKSPDELRKEKHEGNKDEDRVATIAVYMTFVVNIVLFIGITSVTVLSGSIAIIASLVDSILDFISNVTIILTTYATKNPNNTYKYPGGTRRITPAGIMIFSALMGTSSLLLISEAIRTMISSPDSKPDISPMAIGIFAGVVFVKIACAAYCYYLGKKSGSSTAMLVYQDHRNDILLNAVAIASAYLGYLYYPNIDRIGALCISVYTGFNWASTCFEQVKLLTGRAASPEFLQLLTWVAWNHDRRIIAIDTVRAFHFGERFLVEIDIVLPPEMQLREAHDIGERLQQKLESLDDVERAFVHLDFETDHKPMNEHFS